MPLSPVLRLSTLGMLALSLSACSLTGTAEPTSGPTAKPAETPAMTSTPVAMEAKIDGETIATPPSSPAAAAMKSFTMTEVATHDSGDSCYIVYKGGVYDITAFVPKHPKGPKPLTKCGQAVDDFSELHPGGAFDNSPERIAFMESMRIGTLKQ